MDTAHAASNTGQPLPPGSLGPPWIGETLAFVQDPFAFFAERRKKHGLVFRTRLLGEPVICLTGPEAVSLFYDTRYFTRVDASLPQFRELLHPEAIPFLDQSLAHTVRRQLLLQAFTPEATRRVCALARADHGALPREVGKNGVAALGARA